jgi:hypothetical protein
VLLSPKMDQLRPSLRGHVVHVIDVAAEEQVSGVDAGRIVAAVAHFGAPWVDSRRQKVRDARCAKSHAQNPKGSVALRMA